MHDALHKANYSSCQYRSSISLHLHSTSEATCCGGSRGGHEINPVKLSDNQRIESFAEIPAEVRRRLACGERVLLVLLDAFGRDFLDAHSSHPLVQRLEVTPLRSQFPSTTTAHVTTLHFGPPVQEHGLYEWNLLEPALGEIICPLRFNSAGAAADETLSGRLDPAVLAPGPTFYETLGAPSAVAQPRAIAASVFTRLATVGAQMIAFDDLHGGALAVARALHQREELRYVLLYWDAIDHCGHQRGPGSPAFRAACRDALDALWHGLRELEGVSVLVTADHGQIDVRPDRVDHLDELWPELPALLSQPRPAGSSRDAFLHVRPGEIQRVIDGLGARLDGRAEVRRADELFTEIGPRLRARLGDVVVLPAPGRQVWLRSAAAHERWFRGQHGGCLNAETSTYLAELMR